MMDKIIANIPYVLYISLEYDGHVNVMDTIIANIPYVLYISLEYDGQDNKQSVKEVK